MTQAAWSWVGLPPSPLFVMGIAVTIRLSAMDRPMSRVGNDLVYLLRDSSRPLVCARHRRPTVSRAMPPGPSLRSPVDAETGDRRSSARQLTFWSFSACRSQRKPTPM